MTPRFKKSDRNNMKALGGRGMRGRAADESAGITEVEDVDAAGRVIGFSTEDDSRGLEKIRGSSHGSKLEKCPYLGIP